MSVSGCHKLSTAAAAPHAPGGHTALDVQNKSAYMKAAEERLHARQQADASSEMPAGGTASLAMMAPASAALLQSTASMSTLRTVRTLPCLHGGTMADHVEPYSRPSTRDHHRMAAASCPLPALCNAVLFP